MRNIFQLFSLTPERILFKKKGRKEGDDERQGQAESTNIEARAGSTDRGGRG